MKISLNLMKKFFDFNETDVQKIERRFTDKSAEIDDVHFQNKGLEKVVIGKIETISKHPDADKMQVTQTNVGGEVLQIVCGAKNIFEGQFVPVALNGAVLPGDFEIKKADKRGVESNGMICAETEMGIAEKSEGIMDLGKAFPDVNFEEKIGDYFAEFYGLDDVIFEVENTAITNRPDLFSHFGWVREAKTIGLGEFKKNFDFKNFEMDEKIFEGKEDFPINFSIEKGLAKKISGFKISGVENGDSPDWMKKFLNSVGINSISLLVDITNYVMIVTGVPMHAFDLAKINGRDIKFRSSKKGEKLIILDGDEKELPENAIIMEDADGIFDLCGIQGGKNSGVDENTSDAWCHFATYDPVLIRRASISVDKRSDASTIFEKDVPTSELEKAIKLTIDLISELSPKSEISSDLFDYNEVGNGLKPFLTISKEKVDFYFGEKIEEEKIINILESLGFGVKNNSENFEVKIPGFRFKDIEIEEDLIEEIMRVYGLDTIKTIAPNTEIHIAKLQNQYNLTKKSADFLAKKGLHEAINFGFLGRNLLEKSGFSTENLIEITNPLSEKLEAMRTSLVPYLLENSQKNILNFKEFGLFEIGKTFGREGLKKSEKTKLAFIIVGKEFFEGKEIVQNLFEELGPKIDFKNAQNELKYAHGGQNAEIIMQGKAMGNYFTLHPKVAKNFDLPKNTVVFECDFDKVVSAKIRTKKLKQIPQFPSSTRDETKIFDSKTEIGNVVKKVSGADKLLKNIELVDQFESEEKIGKGKISLTFRFEYFDETKTLGDQEVNDAHLKVKEKFLSFD